MKIIKLNSLQSYQAKKLYELLKTTGWKENQITGQLIAIKRLVKDKQNGAVIVANSDHLFCGFISAQFYEWNKLGQIHGLAVHPIYKRQGIASKLIKEIENFMNAKSARGIYLDTPTTNTEARKLYSKLGYQEAYVMPEYYDEGNDGITYLKLFK